MLTGSLSPGEVTELAGERAAASAQAQAAAEKITPGPATPPPAGKADAPALTLDRYAGGVLELAGTFEQFTGRELAPERLGLVTVMTFPAAKRWAPRVEDVPAPIALGLMLGGLLVLVAELGLIPRRAPAAPPPPPPPGQGRA